MSILANAALKYAITQIGEDEKPHGSNWGTPVQDYLANVGIHFPASWCAAFVYTCFIHAEIETKITNRVPKTGGVLNMLQHTPQNQIFKKPEIGDIFIIDFGGGLGHTGIVERFDDTFIYTVEGNTNDTGSREGIEVCRRKRTIKSIRAFLRY